MQKGWIISISLHLVALAAGLFAIPYNDDRDRDVSRVTEVSIITAPQGDREQAPTPPENAPQVDEQVASIAAPDFDPDAGPAPEADLAPTETVKDDIEDPSARDTEADLTALLEEVAEPDVAVDVAAPDESATAPDAAPPALAMPGDTGLDSRNETPRGPQMAAPPAPRSAPRIADFQPPAPPSPPSEREAEPETTPEETETAAAEPETVAQPEEASPAPPSEVESGAEEGSALRRSTAPRARPRNFETQLAEAEAERERQEEAARVAAAEQREREEEAARAAEEARREAEAAAVAEALASAQDNQQTAPDSDPMAPPSSVTQDLPVGPPLTQGEKDALRLSVQRCWNVPAGLPNATDLRVVVAVELSPNGQIVGQPRLIEPADANRPEIRVAFEAARRALLRCQGSGYELPQDKFAQWKNLEVAFDPKGMLSRW
ncbi:hypothetical protein ACW9UR_08635 [Halovulum sp. GXIMD14794]